MSLSAFVLVDAILLIGNHTISEYLPLHTVALFASQSTSHRIAVTAGSAIAFALYGGLMAFLYNYNLIPQIECIFVEAPIGGKPNWRLRQQDVNIQVPVLRVGSGV